MSAEWLHGLFMRARDQLRQLGLLLTPELLRSIRDNGASSMPSRLRPIAHAIDARFFQPTQGLQYRSDPELVGEIEQFRRTYLASTQAVWDTIICTDFRTDEDSDMVGASYAMRMWSATQCADMGRAAYFVCHDINSSFHSLDDAIESFVKLERLDAKKTYVWLDLFSGPVSDI